MIYSEEELLNLEEEEGNQDEEDRPEDINPALYAYKSKPHEGPVVFRAAGQPCLWD